VTAGGLAGLLGGGAAPALAAPCAAGLTVAGTAPGTQGPPLQVTGSDCVAQGDGTIRVTDPKLGGFGGVPGSVAIDGTMILAADRSSLVREALTLPLVVRVDGDPVLTGPIEVKDVEFCDLKPPGPAPPFLLAPSSPLPDPAGGAVGANVALPEQVNCRLAPGMLLTSPVPGSVVKLLGLDGAVRPGQVPFLVDNERGGRIVGVLPFRIPLPGIPVRASSAPAIGFLFEVSATLGTQLIGISGEYPRGFTIPGTDIGVRQIGLNIVPAESRFGGGATISAGGFRTRGEFEVLNQRIQRISAVVALPRPGVAVFPPSFFISGLGFGFEGGATLTLPSGGTISLPARLSGTATWALTDPAGAVRVGGQMNVTLGNGLQFTGSYCLDTPLKPCTAALAQARVLIKSSPFRFEAQNTINVLSGTFVGNVSGGATLNPFHVTYLGRLSVRLPQVVPVVGGRTIGGLQSAVSDRAAGAVTRIPNPFGEDPTVGAGFFWSPFQVRVISGLQSVTTVTPSTAGSSSFARSQATVRSARLRAGLGQVLVEVRGARRAPRAVSLRSSSGALRAHRVPGASGRSVAFILSRPPAGTLVVSTPDAVSRVVVSRIRPFPYLDPSPGYGTRRRPSVTAGTPVRVCWDIRFAGRDLQVDLLEDQNGRLGTGRTIAENQPAHGCFSISTTGLEPGRHWVYGQVHDRLGVPISTRYWPIPITIIDPAALPAPGGLRVTPTRDGATVSFSEVDGAGLYLIRAEPTEEGADPPVEAQVASGAAGEVSLRGSRSWRVSVQAAGLDGKAGNIAGPLPVTPTAGVVVSGTPNGLAEIGKPWAFKLATRNLARLRLVSGPRGTRLSRSGLVRWTPSRAAIKSGFVTFSVEGCSADDRCVQRSFNVTAFDADFLPLGPIRGFSLLQSVVRPGGRITLLAQGVSGRVRVRIDGRPVTARVLDSGTVQAVLPRRLGRGSHDVALRIGGNLEEVAAGAIVVR
jgi:hypothetical protein